MSSENEAVVRRVYEEGWNAGRLDVLDECLAAGYVDHEAPPGIPRGPAGARQLFAMYKSVFSDDRWTIEDIFSAGDRVTVRIRVDATHAGDFMGARPSGRRVVMHGIDVFRLADGRVTEHWGAMNAADLMAIVRGSV